MQEKKEKQTKKEKNYKKRKNIKVEKLKNKKIERKYYERTNKRK